MRVGLLGAGNISDTHARAARAIPGVEIVAVSGANRDKVARLTGAYGGVPYDTVDAFLAHRPMDIVAIGSPSGLHADQTIAAMRRGLHVLVEKPLDVTRAKVDAVIAEAARAGLCRRCEVQSMTSPCSTLMAKSTRTPSRTVR